MNGQTGRNYLTTTIDEWEASRNAAQAAMALLYDIGQPLEQATVQALFTKFLDGVSWDEAGDEGWASLWSEMSRTLEKLGHSRRV